MQGLAERSYEKLRNIPEAYKIDPRGNLFLRYLAYVRALRPLALLMENVPDILHYGGHNVIEEVVEALFEMGYEAKYTLINSAFHGCPQMRDRVFLVGRLSGAGGGNQFSESHQPYQVASWLRRNSSSSTTLRGPF